jgi:tryptophanyl-tRNA synthetase
LPITRCRSCLSTTRLPARRRTVHTSSTTEASPDRVIFSGIQPTGVPHIGNYLGALREWVRLQNDAGAKDKYIYSIVDLHALTGNQSPQELRQRRKESFAMLLAIGLDPTKSILFYQSDVRGMVLIQSMVASG